MARTQKKSGSKPGKGKRKAPKKTSKRRVAHPVFRIVIPALVLLTVVAFAAHRSGVGALGRLDALTGPFFTEEIRPGQDMERIAEKGGWVEATGIPDYKYTVKISISGETRFFFRMVEYGDSLIFRSAELATPDSIESALTPQRVKGALQRLNDSPRGDRLRRLFQDRHGIRLGTRCYLVECDASKGVGLAVAAAVVLGLCAVVALAARRRGGRR